MVRRSAAAPQPHDEPTVQAGVVTGRLPDTPAPAVLTELSDAELLAEYNLRSPTRRRARFKTREEAIERINALAPVASPQQKPKREPKNVRARMANLKIVLLVEENPRRPDTAAHKHFEKMRGNITIRQYLAKFDEADQRVARQWLWNTLQDGYIKTVAEG